MQVGYSPSYCTTFSQTGRYFLASSKEEITVFDGTDPFRLKKTHFFNDLDVSWTVTDMDVLEDKHIATYSTMNSTVNVLDLENNQHR